MKELEVSRLKRDFEKTRGAKKLRPGCSLIGAVMFSLIALPGQAESSNQARWDQQEAVKRVNCVTAMEDANDFAWDKIAWLTDPSQAAAQARTQDKPILVYFFLKGKSGPQAAPC